jgi:dTMP kinase
MFVTFEGPEGAGKSTAIQAVASHLRETGYNVLQTREPGAGVTGKQIRDILLHGEDLPASTELFLFLADRSHHVARVIRPALKEGKVVLCDRYADSTWVYQSYARGLDSAFVKACNEFATGGLWPNLTLLLDLPAEVGLGRLTQPDRLDQEPISFHQRVRDGFLDLAHANESRWRIVDGGQTKERVAKAAIEIVALELESRAL